MGSSNGDGSSDQIGARLAHPRQDAQGHPPDRPPSGFPSGRPFKAGWADSGPGPHCSQAGRRSLPPPVCRRPVGSDAPERPPPDGSKLHLLHSGPSGGINHSPRAIIISMESSYGKLAWIKSALLMLQLTGKHWPASPVIPAFAGIQCLNLIVSFRKSSILNSMDSPRWKMGSRRGDGVAISYAITLFLTARWSSGLPIHAAGDPADDSGPKRFPHTGS